jgi:carbon monoxide dehydrogenase subunit G
MREDGRYDASIGVKFGIIALRFSGVARVSYDLPEHRVTLEAQGRDAARTTRAMGDVIVTLSEAPAGTGIEVRGTFEFAGPTAHLAQTGARAVAGSMLRSFAECIGQHVAVAQGGGSE